MSELNCLKKRLNYEMDAKVAELSFDYVGAKKKTPSS